MTVTIKISAIRGTTSYDFETTQETGVEEYAAAEQDATKFEAWLSAMPERQQLNDAKSLARGA